VLYLVDLLNCLLFPSTAADHPPLRHGGQLSKPNFFFCSSYTVSYVPLDLLDSRQKQGLKLPPPLSTPRQQNACWPGLLFFPFLLPTFTPPPRGSQSLGAFGLSPADFPFFSLFGNFVAVFFRDCGSAHSQDSVPTIRLSPPLGLAAVNLRTLFALYLPRRDENRI